MAWDGTKISIFSTIHSRLPQGIQHLCINKSKKFIYFDIWFRLFLNMLWLPATRCTQRWIIKQPMKLLITLTLTLTLSTNWTINHLPLHLFAIAAPHHLQPHSSLTKTSLLDTLLLWRGRLAVGEFRWVRFELYIQEGNFSPGHLQHGFFSELDANKVTPQEN